MAAWGIDVMRRTAGAPVRAARDPAKALIVLAVSSLVFLLVAKGGEKATLLGVALLAGLGVALWARRRPATALASVFIVLPLQQTVLAWLYAHGAPRALVRGAGFGKEAVLVGLLVAVLSDPVARRTRMRPPDIAALVLLAVATFYLVLPAVVSGSLGGQPNSVRISAWRLNVLFVVLFLVVRRLPWTSRDLHRMATSLVLVGGALAVGGIWEMIDKTGYDDFLTNVAQQPRFVAEVLQGVTQQGSVVVYGSVGSSEFVRVGSWVIDALTLGFVLVLPIAVGLQRLARRAGRSWVLALTAMSVVVLLATLTRSAILAGILASGVVIGLALHGQQRRAAGLAVILALAVMLTLPFLPGTNLATRFTGAQTGTDVSAQEHSSRSREALTLSLRTPLGLGLGSNPGSFVTYDTSNGRVASEDYYLQVFLELGWAGGLAFAALVVTLIREAWSTALRHPGSQAVPVAAAAAGLSLGAFFLHVWLDFQTALLFWGFAGAVLALRAQLDEPSAHVVDPALAEVT